MPEHTCKHGKAPGEYCGDCYREATSPNVRRRVSQPIQHQDGFSSDDRQEFEKLKQQGRIVDKILLVVVAIIVLWLITTLIGALADARAH